MSTEHQQYSTENQADKIREYAARRGIEIIKTYADVGLHILVSTQHQDYSSQLVSLRPIEKDGSGDGWK